MVERTTPPEYMANKPLVEEYDVLVVGAGWVWEIHVLVKSFWHFSERIVNPVFFDVRQIIIFH